MGLLLLIAVVVGIAGCGVLLFIVGLRGRLVDDHPHCRRCAFDLVGQQRAAGVGADGARCSECGAGLGSARSVRVGTRVRRRRALGFGVGILGLMLAGVGGVVWASLSGKNLNVWKPGWLLVSEAEWLPPELDTPGFVSEIGARLAAKTLTPEQIGRLVARALLVQGRMDLAWDPAWGDVMHEARALGVAGDAEWEKFLQGVVAGVEVRVRDPGVSMEEGWPLLLSVPKSRCGSVTRLSVSPVIERITIDGKELAFKKQIGRMAISTIGTSSSSQRCPCEAEPGRRTMVLSLRLEVFDGFSGPRLLTKSYEKAFPVEIVPAGTALAMMVFDPALEQAVNGSISVFQKSGLKIARVAPRLDGGEDSFQVEWYIDLSDLPANVAGRVVARRPASGAEPAREWELGTVVFARGLTTSYGSIQALQEWDPTITSVDLVIVPDTKVAESSLDVRQIWGREIVVPNVAVFGPGEEKK